MVAQQCIQNVRYILLVAQTFIQYMCVRYILLVAQTFIQYMYVRYILLVAQTCIQDVRYILLVAQIYIQWMVGNPSQTIVHRLTIEPNKQFLD